MEISSIYKSVAKIMILYYTTPEIWRETDVIFIFQFGPLFYPFTDGRTDGRTERMTYIGGRPTYELY